METVGAEPDSIDNITAAPVTSSMIVARERPSNPVADLVPFGR